MNVEATHSREPMLTSDETESSDEELKAIFQQSYKKHPERMGGEGYWIIPALILSLGMLFAFGKLIYWIISVIMSF